MQMFRGSIWFCNKHSLQTPLPLGEVGLSGPLGGCVTKNHDLQSLPWSCIKHCSEERITLGRQSFLRFVVVFAEVTVREVCRQSFSCDVVSAYANCFKNEIDQTSLKRPPCIYFAAGTNP